MIAPGDRLDLDFPVRVAVGGREQQTSFAALLTRKSVVSVYMKNNTGSCDRQNASLAAHAGAIDRMGFNLIAVSRDSCGSHLRYAAAKAIPYVLVSDPEDRFAQATGSLIEKKMYGRSFVGPARAAYVLAPDGRVLAVLPKVDAANHGEQVLAALQRV